MTYSERKISMKITVASLIFLCALSFCSPAFAAEKSIGVIMTGNIPYYKELHKALVDALPGEGLGPGSVEIILQTPTPEPMAWTNAARKLVAVGADVIVAYGAPAAMAVVSETSDVPVVYAAVYDPVAIGITGKNATGISSKVPIASLLKGLKSISNFNSLGVVFSDAEKDTIVQANEVKQLEGSLGFHSTRFNIKRMEDASKISNIDALMLTTGCAAMHCVNNILGIAQKSKIPTASTIGGGESTGVILTIAANPQEQGREAAKIVAKVVKGSKPSTLPFVSAKKIDMVINLKAATEMGLKIPIDLLTTATKVIK